jgi:hypothetical protein
VGARCWVSEGATRLGCFFRRHPGEDPGGCRHADPVRGVVWCGTGPGVVAGCVAGVLIRG